MKKRKTGDNRIVLVGTYKGDQLAKWRGWYNAIAARSARLRNHRAT